MGNKELLYMYPNRDSMGDYFYYRYQFMRILYRMDSSVCKECCCIHNFKFATKRTVYNVHKWPVTAVSDDTKGFIMTTTYPLDNIRINLPEMNARDF